MGVTGVILYDSNEGLYDPYGNLEGYIKGTKIKQFTWQPHGSQFTITEQVPNNTLIIKLKSPEKLDKIEVLKAIGFDKTWVTIYK